MNDKAICTIIAKNYISAARVLTDSFQKFNPGIDVYVLVIDKLDGYITPKSEKFKIVTVEDLADDEVIRLLFKYDILEASTAVKPFLLKYLIDKYELSKLIYFDPDILFTESVAELWDFLDRNNILLTPHLLGPSKNDEKHVRMELDILRCGTYNLGFLAISQSTEVQDFLEWWGERLGKYCSRDVMPLFTDQKWVNLIPGYFENVYMLRNPGYNVAYWNLSNRDIQGNGEDISVNGYPLRFFHFSGLDITDLNGISKYQDRFTLDDFEVLKPLFNKYKELLFSHGYEESSNWPFYYDKFDNGLSIPGVVRKVYLNMSIKGGVSRFGDPFLTGIGSYYDWLNQPARQLKSQVTNFWHQIYMSRPDLVATFPDVFDKDNDAFIKWCVLEGQRVYNPGDKFIQVPALENSQITQGKGFERFLLKTVWLPLRSAATAIGRMAVKNPRTLQGLYYIRKGIDRIFSNN